MDFVLFAAPIFLSVILPATTAMSMIPILIFWSFGRKRWASRRALAAYIVFGLLGYLASLAYYTVVGVPAGASSMYNLAVLGAFFGSGYGGTAALFYYERHRENPTRKPPAREVHDGVV
jgi:hypothetical protein